MPEYNSIRRLLSPLSPERFFSEIWEKRTEIIQRSEPNYYSDLLSLDDIDTVLTTLNLRYPEIRLSNAAQETIASQGYTLLDGRVDPGAVLRLFDDGATIIFNQMQRRLPKLGTLCRELQDELGVDFQTNLYLSPPHGGGFKVHYDTHDVFVLQLAGSKEWEFFESGLELPMPGQHHESAGIKPGACERRFTLHRGDVAYIPRGVFHSARAGNEMSLHITLGALVTTWCEFVLETIAELSLRDVALRRALPLNSDSADLAQQFQSLLDHIRSQADPASVSETLTKPKGADMRGRLTQFQLLATLGFESQVVANTGLVRGIETVGETVVVTTIDAAIELPSRAAPTVADVLGGEPRRICDIAGPLDNESKLVVVRRLVKEGLVHIL